MCRTRELVDTSKARVVKAANQLLTSGLKSQSQADVASALQTFFNLNTLRQVCLGTVESYASDLGVALRAATDSRQLGGLVGQVSAPLSSATKHHLAPCHCICDPFVYSDSGQVDCSLSYWYRDAPMPLQLTGALQLRACACMVIES